MTWPNKFLWGNTPRNADEYGNNASLGEMTSSTIEAAADRPQTIASKSITSSPSKLPATPIVPMMNHKYMTPRRTVIGGSTDHRAERSKKHTSASARIPPAVIVFLRNARPNSRRLAAIIIKLRDSVILSPDLRAHSP